MSSRTRIAACLAIGSFSLVASGCGGSGGGNTAAAPATTTTASSGSPMATVEQPRSIEAWEALWAKERDAMVTRIKDNKWGKSADGKTLTGPDGFTIDLSKCATGWSDTQGLSDTTIKIGDPTALSGVAADFGNISKTMKAWFKYQSDRGLFKDALGKTRSVDLIVRDDAYDPAKTISIVDEMLDLNKVFAIETLGTPSTLRVYDKINRRCVPHPLVIGGSPAWGDPVNHPWTTGSIMSFPTEARIWAAFIDQHIDELTKANGKATITALVANNDYGTAYESAFKAAIAASPNKKKIKFITERVDITAPTVTDAMTTLASKNANMFITMTGGPQCTQVINEVAGNQMASQLKYKFMSSGCKPAAFVGKAKVGGDGSQSNGWYIAGGGQKDINDPAYDNDGFSVWARKFLSDYGLSSKASSNLGNGFFPAWVWSQALAVAGQLDGGLTRSNLIVALRAFDGTSPVHFPGVKINLSGNKDAFLVEGSDLSVFDSAKQQWIEQGDIVDQSGKTKSCTWSTSANACS